MINVVVKMKNYFKKKNRLSSMINGKYGGIPDEYMIFLRISMAEEVISPEFRLKNIDDKIISSKNIKLCH